MLPGPIAMRQARCSADEETTLKTLKTYREIIDGLIDRHDGRIFGTAGDSVVAEFGSTVEAVRCAMSIQEELRVRNAELVEDLRMMFRIPDVRMHDLRHSYASVAAGIGESLPIIGKLLGHTQAQTTARYAHLAADPVHDAAERIAEKLNSTMKVA